MIENQNDATFGLSYRSEEFISFDIYQVYRLDDLLSVHICPVGISYPYDFGVIF